MFLLLLFAGCPQGPEGLPDSLPPDGADIEAVTLPHASPAEQFDQLRRKREALRVQARALLQGEPELRFVDTPPLAGALPDGTVPLDLGDGEVVLMGELPKLQDIVQQALDQRDLDKLRARLDRVLSLAPEACAADASGGDDVASLRSDIAAVAACARAADEASDDPPRARFQPGGLGALLPWRFDDLPPVRDQRNRGTCVAFAIVSAIERASAGRRINLSEQHLYAVGLLLYEDRFMGDGISTCGFVDWLADERRVLPFEGVWPYNGSPQRRQCYRGAAGCIPTNEDDFDYYDRSCVGYPSPPFACSETAPQSFHWMVDGDDVFGLPGVPGGAGMRLTDASGVGGGDSDEVRLLARSGEPLVASFSVYSNFQGSVWYDGPGAMDSEIGGHAVHVVDFVRNSELPFGLTPAPGGAGEGWYVLKNSWSVGLHDDGYVYMTSRAYDDLVHSSVTFTVERAPGNTPPAVRIRLPAAGTSWTEGRGGSIPLNLRAELSDLEDVLLDVRWTAEPSGVVIATEEVEQVEPWTVPTATASIAQVDSWTVPAGTRSIAVTVTDRDGATARASVSVSPASPSPEAVIFEPVDNATVYAGAPFRVRAEAYDPGSVLLIRTLDCSRLRWTTDVAADGTFSGCDDTITLQGVGARRLILTATEPEGSTVTTSVRLSVVDPPLGAPPVVFIVAPAEDGTTVYNTERLAAVTDDTDRTLPLGQIEVRCRWSARALDGGPELVIEESTEVLDRTGCTVNWNTALQLCEGCYREDILLTVVATDPEGMASDSIVVRHNVLF